MAFKATKSKGRRVACARRSAWRVFCDRREHLAAISISAANCIFLNEALVPVMYLINEASIAPGMPPDVSAIEYYHIDLDTHDVIYAEGALVESFFDDGSNRENFSNFVQYERLYGVERKSEMTPFAPILKYRGRRQELKGLVRSLISNVVDVRDPIQIAYDQLAKRAESMLV